MRVKIFKFWPILHTGHAFLFIFACMQISCDITSASFAYENCVQKAASMENFQIFEYLDLNYSALLAD